MLWLRVNAGYHVRKARVLSPVNLSFTAHKKLMKKAREQVHVEAIEYHNKIQDQYLKKHHEEMKKKHFENQCKFRKHVLVEAYRLIENQGKRKQSDQRFQSRLNKFLHDQDVRKINRSRIIKIMEHESQNYWYNSNNVDERLTNEILFPEYIASTEYYYRLFAQALAYELGDFTDLHRVTSTEDIIREKNKMLIPIFLELRGKIASFKRDEEKEQHQRYLIEKERINLNVKLTKLQKANLLQQAEKIHAEKLKAIAEKQNDRKEFYRERLTALLSILKSWKEYTNILAMTSAQILSDQDDLVKEGKIRSAEREIMNATKAKTNEVLISSIEEDTEDMEISFEEYIAKINKQKKDSQVPAQENSSLESLDNLLKEVGLQPENNHAKQEETLDVSKIVEAPSSSDIRESLKLGVEVSSEFLNPKETTASVEVLKEEFKQDGDLVKLLNQVGEIDVRYPKLFETVWATIEI